MRIILLVVLCSGLLCRTAVGAENTWVYAVQLSASVQEAPPKINLSWRQDVYGAQSYAVFRKSKSSVQWSWLADLPGSATSFSDDTVNLGQDYEYQVIKSGTLGYKGYGYIYTGIHVPPTHSRGKVLLVVETNATAPLNSELERFTLDLSADGWEIARLNVSSNQTPASVRSMIIAAYQAEPQKLNSVFLLGRVPILFSGNVDWDTHGPRPMPADGYYGDVDGDWSSSPSFFPSNVELMVGRVDFAGMPGLLAPEPWPSETELLRNYLNKDHAWRTRQETALRRALMGNRRGDEGGGAPAASAYRFFDAAVGPGNTEEANTSDVAPPAERWISRLGAGSYLWAYGCGGGQPIGVSGLGMHGIYNDVYGVDFRALNARAAFSFLFGSWLADWQNKDNILRAALATPQLGLASGMAGRPHWFLHHMALGETIGFSARLSMNNRDTYRNELNALAGAVYVTLFGDPTLRSEILAPPSALTAQSADGNVSLSWTASADPNSGYYVYRSQSMLGPFIRLNESPIPGTTFFHANAGQGSWIYLVRAVSLENRSSGSWYNLSLGIRASVNVVDGGTGQEPIQAFPVTISHIGTNVQLSWTNVPGQVYYVEATDTFPGGDWILISGPVSSSESHCFWTDPSGASLSRGFYRVVSR